MSPQCHVLLVQASLLVAVMLVSVGEVAASTLPPAVIRYTAPGQFPESADWDSRSKKFYVGSLRLGNIGVVEDSGRFGVFIKDASYSGNRTQGVLVDPPRNRLITTIFGGGAFQGPGGGFGAVAAYDLRTKRRLVYTRLDTVGPQGTSLGAFPNDVAVESRSGTLWVTDSFRGLLWRISGRTGKASVVRSSVLTSGAKTCPADIPITLNGIVYHPRRFLLVANLRTGALIKVTPGRRIKLARVAQVSIPCADGLRLRPDGRLVVVTQTQVLLIESRDGWKSGRIVQRVAQDVSKSATAVAIRGGSAYVSYAFFDSLGTAKSDFLLNSTAANFAPIR